jgi:hypothetical protein
MYTRTFLYYQCPCIYLLYYSIVFRLSSYHTDVEVAQKGTQSLPDDGTVLPKHVAAIIKNKEVYMNPVLLFRFF